MFICLACAGACHVSGMMLPLCSSGSFWHAGLQQVAVLATAGDEKSDSGRVRRSDAACDSSNKVKGVRRANVGCSSKPYCYVLLKQPAFSASHRSPVGGGFDHEEMGTDGTESPSGAAGQCDTFSYYVQHICIMCRTRHCLVPSCA